MLNYSNAKIKDVIVHYVGSKLQDDGCTLSDSTSKKSIESIDSILTNLFLSPFKQSELHTFWHESDLRLNNCYSFVTDIFENRKMFTSKSKSIAKLLYENSVHPKISGGELYISYFENCILDDEVIDALAIFKFESKDTFLQSYKSENHFEIKSLEGIKIDEIDKACLVLNSKANEGLKLFVVDNANKSNEAQYWKENFLKIKPLVNEYHFTKEFMSLTRDYVTNQLDEEFEIDKTNKIELLNRTSKYFKTHEVFNKKEFEDAVFQEPDLIQSFRNYKQEFANDELRKIQNFGISENAVKRQSRIFKSVLKLDKNFHVYIHGDTNMIERGTEEDGRKYYKIYYKEEN